MASEKQKMLSGAPYDARDPQLFAGRRRARLLFKAFNDTPDDQPAERERLLRALIPECGREVWIEPPFHCDYGSNEVWIGGGAIVCPGVRIGARSVIGAGSVVTHDIPQDVFAAGNPCRVLRAQPGPIGT